MPQQIHTLESHTGTTTATENPRLLTSDSGLVSQYAAQAVNNTFQLYQGANAQATGTTSLGGSEQLYYNGQKIVGEQVFEHEIVQPTKHIVEETIERVYVVPEKIQKEVVTEDRKIIRERVITVAKPVEKLVYVKDPQIVTRERFVEKIVPVQQEKVVYQDVWETREVIKEVEIDVIEEKIKYIEQEKVVFKDVDRIVERPRLVLKENIIEQPIDEFVDVEVPVIKTVEVYNEVYRKEPVPMEHVVHQEYELPSLQADYDEENYLVFLPQFVEVPVPADQLTDEAILQAEELRANINQAISGGMPSACHVVDLGDQARNFQLNHISNPQTMQERMADKIAKAHKSQKE